MQRLDQPAAADLQHLNIGGARSAYPDPVRRNTLLAIVLLLSAIVIAGVIGVVRLYQITG